MDAATLADVPRLDLDPFARETLAAPYPCDTAIREAAPLVKLAPYDLWATGRYDLAQKVLFDHATFSSASGAGLTHVRRETPWRRPSPILEADPPEHTRARSVLMRILSPHTAKRLREEFSAEAERLVEEVTARGRFDAARDLAEIFPLRVLPDVIGIPEEGREHLLPYANMNFNLAGPRNALAEEAIARAGDAADHVIRMCSREALAPGGFGAQIYEAADRGELDPQDAPLLVRSFLTAGLDTTVYGIGYAIHLLAQAPEQWALLAAEPERAKAVFEEVLRFVTVSPFLARTTTKPVELAGVTIPADEKIMICIGAANRDPRKWEDPDRFDITRKTTGHLGFGIGIHGCVGQIIARLEAEVVLGALARRVATLEPDGEAVPRPTNWLRGMASVPVRVRMK